jgi:hypothetical protein
MGYKIRTRDELLLNDGSQKRILALDGGGLRGILTLSYLAEIESMLRDRHGGSKDFRLNHYFDLIAGTSTGSIIAAALARGMAVADDCADLMEILLQWMSSSHTARMIDREMGDLRHDSIAPAPLINYLRYNIALTKESLTPLGIDLPDAKFESLSAMDDPANMPTLQDVGARAAKQQVRGEDFPSNFDLVG